MKKPSLWEEEMLNFLEDDGEMNLTEGVRTDRKLQSLLLTMMNMIVVVNRSDFVLYYFFYILEIRK